MSWRCVHCVEQARGRPFASKEELDEVEAPARSTDLCDDCGANVPAGLRRELAADERAAQARLPLRVAVTAEEAMERLQCAEERLVELRETKLIFATKPGKRWMYDIASIDAYLTKQSEPARAPTRPRESSAAFAAALDKVKA